MPKGRILKGVGGLYTVDVPDLKKTYVCQARGKFRIQNISPLVGDIVEISITDEHKQVGYLLEISERKNELIRPKASNIDIAIIVFAAIKPAFNPDLLDKFLLTAEYQIKNIEIVICINKLDLAERFPFNIAEIKNAYKKAGYKFFLVSAKDRKGFDELEQTLNGKTSILAGPSGVGKSSILNIITPEASANTGEISRKTERGKHTTRHAELYSVPSLPNTYVADSPGFSSISPDIIPKEDLQSCFAEFRPFLGQCYFTDCRHITENDCAIKEQVGKKIDSMRYERYIKYYKGMI